ncbi:MAG: histidine phosphatase family protein [Myxococcota bacterium]
MATLRRIVLLRHGNTVGDSHERFHGSSDVSLSDEGRGQVRAAGLAMATEVFDLVVSSPLSRAWQSASMLAGGQPVRLMPEFREIHFGRWEGLTAQEIQERDPALYQAWQEGAADFGFPNGEPLDAFRTRVLAGLDQLKNSGAANILVVAHKGVIRTIVQQLVGEAPDADAPALGEIVSVTQDGEGWILGRRSSDPEGVNEDAA